MGNSKEYPIGHVDKLVRDKIPQAIKDSKRGIPITHIASGEEYPRRLRAKLREEVGELLQAQDVMGVKEEIADIVEVLHSYAQLAGLEMKEIEVYRQTKHTTNGGFATGTVLERVVNPSKP